MSSRLHYSAQSRRRAAFVEEIQRFSGGQVHIHFDDEEGARPPDVSELRSGIELNEHIYCCGPSGLMYAVSVLAEHRALGRLHAEWFTPKAKVSQKDGSFEVVLNRSGRKYMVREDQTILEVLEENGSEAAPGCRGRFCGFCEVTLLESIPDHRDTVLPDTGNRLMICVSRSMSGSLVLDL